MRFFNSTIFCIAILSILAMPVLLALHYNNWQYIYTLSTAIYIATFVLIVVFYWYLAKKINPFVLPVSFITFPVTLYFQMTAMRLFLEIRSDPAGWEIFTVFVAIYYSLPFLILTLIISTIYYFKSKKQR